MTNTNTSDEWVVAIEPDSTAHAQPLLFSTLTQAHAETLAITEEELADYYGGRNAGGFYDYAADIWETQWVFEEFDPIQHDYAAIDACGHNFTTENGQ